MLTMDNTALIDPFESDFILNIPIRIDWGIVGLDGKDMSPSCKCRILTTRSTRCSRVSQAATSRFGDTATASNSTSVPTR